MQYNISDLLKGWMRNETLQQVCAFQIIERRCPLSSSVIEIALGDFYDSFPPGEAIGAAPW